MNCKEKMSREIYYMTSLEENIKEEDEVRVVDEVVNKIDLKKLGYKEKERKNNAGCKRYPEKDMLKILVYGYRRGIHSGRKLEESCKYDMRFKWLVGGLTPDANTINDYRKNNIKMIEDAFYEINRIYIKLGILKAQNYSQDGFKIKAVNSKDRNYTKNKVIERIRREEKNIEKQNKIIETLEVEQRKVEKYLKGLEYAEEEENKEEKIRELEKEIKEAKEELERYKSKKSEHEEILTKMKEEGTSQISLTDKESKLMRNNGRFDVAYNNQTAVDVETHLTIGIVTDNNPADVGSMETLGKKIKEKYKETRKEILTNITDKGYQSKEDMMACLETGIIPQVTPNKKEKYVELETEYEEREITEQERKSKEAEDIKKCLRKGIIPECYKEVITEIKIEEETKYEIKEKNVKEEKKITTDEAREKAMSKQIFVKDEENGVVICPMGEVLSPKSRREEKTRYANKLACQYCKNPCTRGKYKEVELRKEQKELYPRNNTLEKPRRIITTKEKVTRKKVKLKLKIDHEALKKRMATSEHSQGTMKRTDNFSSFSMRGKEKVSGEIALHFIASNIRRVTNMIGTVEMIKKLERI